MLKDKGLMIQLIKKGCSNDEISKKSMYSISYIKKMKTELSSSLCQRLDKNMILNKMLELYFLEDDLLNKATLLEKIEKIIRDKDDE